METNNKLREALQEISNLADALDLDNPNVVAILDKCRDALAIPLRNCDVYTADELKVIFKSELASELPIANEHEKNLITITAMRMIDTLFSTTTEGGKK